MHHQDGRAALRRQSALVGMGTSFAIVAAVILQGLVR